MSRFCWVNTDELSIEKIDELAKRQESFTVVAVSNITAVVQKVEGRLEKLGYKCRVVTEYRATSMAAALIPSPAMILGVGAAVGIGVHNLATFNPDYEIGKNKFAGTVTVKYVK
ncbi:hypothetical protein [Dechloromonas sp. ZS-1]|uniref:hypothetical protein n=1 Tax=Dechloromonas sp. ZS-1 TaxID=3138067 RepID=UPI0031FD0971